MGGEIETASTILVPCGVSAQAYKISFEVHCRASDETPAIAALTHKQRVAIGTTRPSASGLGSNSSQPAASAFGLFNARRRIRRAGQLQIELSHNGVVHMSVLNRLTFGALACLIAAPASAQLIQRKDLSYAMAKTIAENALADCKARGYAVSVVVVDRGGDTMVALRADDAGPHTMENARRKAYTARTFRMTTEEFAKRMETEPVRRQQTTLPHVIAIGGGVPIKVGNDVIGGVGLSGSPGVDEPCVNAGIDKVKDQLQ